MAWARCPLFPRTRSAPASWMRSSLTSWPCAGMADRRRFVPALLVILGSAAQAYAAGAPTALPPIEEVVVTASQIAVPARQSPFFAARVSGDVLAHAGDLGDAV